tara:strand:+ start:306 stop:1862 length:1557 start_codon:yes stop_codon:yes gene_type:complete
MNLESQLKNIDKLIKKENKSSYKLALEKINLIQKKLKQNSFILNLKGIIFQKLGKINDSIKCYEDSHNLDKNNISPLNNLANIYQTKSDWELAKKYFDKISELDSNNPIYLINIANFYNSINKIEISCNILEKAIKISPNDNKLLFNLANNFYHTGKFNKSIELFKKIINSNKHFFPAYPQLIKLEKNKEEEQLKLLFNVLNDENMPERVKADLYYSLAIVYERLNKNEEYFDYLKKANKIYQKRKEFKKKNFSDLNLSLIETFKNINFNKKFPMDSKNKKIIFVCGMPRSGTTLIEQILASHSKVKGQGELQYLPTGVINNYLQDGKFNRDKFIEDLEKNENFLAEYYYKQLNFHEVKENIIVDKNPFNFQYLGLINLCFSNAKIILTKRNINDVFYSIYKNYFPSPHMSWSYNEENILEYYKLYNEIIKFWKIKIGENIYEINYEDLIFDNEKEVKNLLKFCEIDFEKECLDHSKNSKSIISTVSVEQARQPIYKSSINKYKKYEKYFNKLFLNIK